MEVSIIIPHYNSVDTLFRLLDSIVFDDNTEVIVVDDKSCSLELEKIKKSKYINKVKFVINDGTKGAGSCRNIGLKLATKKWILFADADDFYLDNYLNIINKNFDSKMDVIYFKPKSCFSDTLEVANRDKEFKNLIENYKKNRNIESLNDLKYNWVVPWSKLIKIDILKKNNIVFDECIAANDVMFSIKLAKESLNIKIVEEEIYCVTVHKGSLTLNLSEENFDSRFEILKRKNYFFQKNNLKKFITPGISYLIRSRKYGFKKMMKVSFYVLKNIKYCFNSRREWKEIMIKIILEKKKIEKYTTKKNGKSYKI